MVAWKRRKKKSSFFAATWNVRSLVEDTGDPRISRVGPARGGVDRGLDFLVHEAEKYRLAVVGVQESKWFGSDIWRASGSTFIHSGCPLPDPGEPAKRNEGVGILFNADMTAR